MWAKGANVPNGLEHPDSRRTNPTTSWYRRCRIPAAILLRRIEMQSVPVCLRRKRPIGGLALSLVIPVTHLASAQQAVPNGSVPQTICGQPVVERADSYHKYWRPQAGSDYIVWD